MYKIFVQIASYRDPQLIPTIEDLLAKASKPDRLTFGICWQYDESEDINKFDQDERFRISKHHYSESQGLGWARSVTNSLYQGEKYTLQIDSHHRFVKGWDDICLQDIKQSSKMSKKPILTTYCTPFDPNNEETKSDIPCLMSQYEFSHDKLLMSMPWFIQDYKERKKVIRARTISGHFMFTYGKFIEEVPYDPDIYFGGYTEETSMSVRAFTHGWDMFSPYRMIMWHEYTRNYRVKHWENHGVESKTSKTSSERDIYSRNKVRQLFGQENHNIDMGIYGLGDVRTLHDYEIYGGFDFKKQLIHDYTLKVNEPPNPQPWEDGFTTKKYLVECDWEVSFFKKQKFKKPKFLTFGLHSESGLEIYREDFTSDRKPEYFTFKKNKYSVTLEAGKAPYKLVMYLYDEEKKWSERYEKIL